MQAPEAVRDFLREDNHASNGRANSGHTREERSGSGLLQNLNFGDMPTLDYIHIIFLIYSAAHNFINAWYRADSAIFFAFVVVGILSVELMLYSIYKHWKSGRLVGKMLQTAKFAGLIAMFYATAGILAQAQSGNGAAWLDMYYMWILPSSAPVMFFFAFLIQSVDPIMEAERDTTAYEHLLGVEERRDMLDQKQLVLNNRKDVRRLKASIQKRKLVAMWRESGSRRTKFTLKRAMRLEMPKILKQIGLPIDDVGYGGRFSGIKALLPGAKNQTKEDVPAKK